MAFAFALARHALENGGEIVQACPLGIVERDPSETHGEQPASSGIVTIVDLEVHALDERVGVRSSAEQPASLVMPAEADFALRQEDEQQRWVVRLERKPATVEPNATYIGYVLLVTRRSLCSARVIALVASLGVSACGGSAPEPPDVSASDAAPTDAAIANRCSGPAPVLDDCVHASPWAECGGTDGEPRFACEGSGGPSGFCLWFANGCVADGFVATTCPSDDVCCIGAAPGSPYPEELRSHFLFAIARTIAGWGTEPWDRERDASVGVVAGPTSADARPSISCVTSSSGGPCAGDSGPPGLRVGRSLHRGVLSVSVTDTHYAIQLHRLSLHVIRDDAGALTSRVCIVPMTDAADGTCHGIGPACAVSGTVTMPSFPETDEEAESIPIDVDAVLEDGSSIVLRL